MAFDSGRAGTISTIVRAITPAVWHQLDLGGLLGPQDELQGPVGEVQNSARPPPSHHLQHDAGTNPEGQEALPQNGMLGQRGDPHPLTHRHIVEGGIRGGS